MKLNGNACDAFEASLEESMDALDNIGLEGGEESMFPDEFQNSGKHQKYFEQLKQNDYLGETL